MLYMANPSYCPGCPREVAVHKAKTTKEYNSPNPEERNPFEGTTDPEELGLKEEETLSFSEVSPLYLGGLSPGSPNDSTNVEDSGDGIKSNSIATIILSVLLKCEIYLFLNSFYILR